jgi:sterol desaturase/sphingolipid hydroxylase (fatty acid hydroxylase superfamily)
VHPAGFTGVTFMTIMPAVLLSATPESFLTMNVLVAMLRLLIHSRIKSDFGPVGRYVVQSPRHHRLHHRLDPSEPAGNFALIPLWDHLFGTWREIPAHEWAIGVDAPYRHGAWVFSDLWRDYCGFWRGWAALIARRDRRDPAAASELL